MSKSIKKNLVFNILLNVSNVLFPLITAPYVARVLMPEGVGMFNFANTFAGYFALLAALGIPTYGVREVAKCGDDNKRLNSLVSEIFTVNVITTIMTSFVFVLSVFLIPQMQEHLLFFLAAGFVIYSKPFNVEWYFQGREEFGFITMRSLVIRVIGIMGLFLLVHSKDDLFIYLLLSVFTSIVNQIWNYIMMIKSGVRPRIVSTGLKKHLHPLFILFSSSIAISIYTVLDTIMLGFISSYSEVAFYNNASHIAKSFLAVVTSLSIVAMPRLSYYRETDNWNEINNLIKKSTSIVAFLALPITFGIVCISPSFVPLFYGDAFYGAIIPLQIMAFVIMAIGFNNLTGVQVLVGLGHDKLFLYSVLVGTFSNFSLNIVLIPLYGAVGASLSSVIAETLILFVTTYFVVSRTPIKLRGGTDIAKSFIGAVTFFPIASICHNFIVGWIYVFTVVIICAFTYILSQYILKSESLLIAKDIITKKIRK